MGEILGRVNELLASEQFLDATLVGLVALMYLGEAGMGKTTVWAQAVSSAIDRSYYALICRPSGSETKLSYAALSDMLGLLGDEALETLPAPQRRALDAALLREDPAGPVDHRAVSMATVSILDTISRERPVVIAVDDLHWLDPPTARVLDFALRRVADRPIGILTSLRPSAENVAPMRLEQLLPEERLRRVALPPLSIAELHHLIAARFDHRFPRPVLTRIHRTSGGNPLFALEIVRALIESGRELAAGEALPVPQTLNELLTERIKGLSVEARLALLIAAAASTPTIQLIHAALGSDLVDRQKEQAVEQAEEKGLVVLEGPSVRFVHPLHASAIYGSAPAVERRRVHRALAGLVDDPEERARHLALSTASPDETVADVVEVGAHRARARGAPDAAAELFQKAEELTPADSTEAAARRALEAATALFDAGDAGHARTILERVVGELPSGRLRAAARQTLAETWLHDSFNESLRLFEASLADAGDDHRLLVRAEMGLTYCVVNLGDFAGADLHARAAVESAERLGEPMILSQALAVQTISDLMLGRGLDRERLSRALELEDWNVIVPEQMQPTMIAAICLSWAGYLEEASDAFQHAHRRFAERGQEALPTFNYTLHECLRGRLDIAEKLAEESGTLASELGAEGSQAIALAEGACVDAYRGHATRCRERGVQSIQLMQSIGWTVAVSWPLYALGFLAVSLEEYEEAHRYLGPVVGRLSAARLAEFSPVPYVGDAVEALIALGHRGSAVELIDQIETSGRQTQGAWSSAIGARCRALLFAAAGDLREAQAAADEALAHHDGLGMPVELGRTILVKGQIHRRLKEKRLATDALTRALETFESVGTPLWAERTRRELSRVGLRPSAPLELTETERRVATLAAAGHTNRSIADQLFVSPKTVEANIARIYRKLGIHSRAELASTFTDHV